MPPLPQGFLERTLLESVVGDDGFYVWDASAGVMKRAYINAVSNAPRRRIDISLSGSQDNWNPTGYDTADVLRVGVPGHHYVITGLAGGVDGRMVWITLAQSPTGFLSLFAGHPSSSAENRFGFGWTAPAVILGTGDTVPLIYDGSSEAWKLAGLPSGHRSLYHESFLDLTTTLASSASGASAATAVAASSDAMREITMTTGTDTTGRAGYSTKAVDLWAPNTRLPMMMVGRFKTPAAISDGTNTYTIRIGFLDSLTGDPTDGIFLRYLHSANSGKFLAVCRSNGSETTADTGVTLAAATVYNFAIHVRPVELLVDFFLLATGDGYPVQVAQIAATIPVAAARAYGAGASIIKSAGGTARILTAYPFSVESRVAW